MLQDDPKAVVVEFWQRCWNEKDLESLDETHVAWFAQNGVPVGTATFKGLFADFFRSFPDVRVSVDDIITECDKVVVRVTYQGTHLGEYQGIAPTGRRVVVTGLEMFLVLGGRIVHHWHEMDHLGILLQIGASVRPPAPV